MTLPENDAGRSTLEPRETTRAPLSSEDLGHCLVTGAAGFLGRHLVMDLLKRGCRVRALVHRAPLAIRHDSLECFPGDVCSMEAMLDACRGIDSVFHTAATIPLMGGVGATRKYRENAYATNVAGTKHTLVAAQRRDVARLVYTSSVDVCFDGSPMPGMHEAMPYARRVKSVYAETKIAAEKMVLAAGARGGPLTCAIRADGIYGAGSNEILDRFVAAVRSGHMVAAVGKAATLQDNSHVDNLVHGEILAARHLVPGGAACGKAFFITDDSPMNAFEFFRPLIEGLGYAFPKWRIPRGVLMPLLTIWQFLHFRLGITAPMMTPHELDKVSVTHFASIERARQELGYQPVKTVAEAMAECLPYCRDLLDRDDRGAGNHQSGTI